MGTSKFGVKNTERITLKYINTFVKSNGFNWRTMDLPHLLPTKLWLKIISTSIIITNVKYSEENIGFIEINQNIQQI